MKKVFQKNQMIIMTLAVVIAVAGYVNYSQKYESAGTKNGKTKPVSKNVAKESAAAVTDDVTDVGEAVLTNAQVSNYVAKAKLEREQVHSKAKDTLEEIIKDQTVKDSVKQDAVDKLAMLSEQMEMDKELDEKARKRYLTLTDDEIIELLINKKWYDTIGVGINELYATISYQLSDRIIELSKRYKNPLPNIMKQTADCEIEVKKYLERMGFTW